MTALDILEILLVEKRHAGQLDNARFLVARAQGEANAIKRKDVPWWWKRLFSK